MPDFKQNIIQRIKYQQTQGLYRQRKIIDSAQSVRVQFEGKDFLNFSSNDYLGLANHPKLKEAFKKGIDLYGCGSGASHLMSGHTQAHHEFEEHMAEFLGVEAVLLYSSGYMANLGVMNSILTKSDTIFQDKLNHASLIDAGLSAQANMKRYSHLDYQHLKTLIDKTQSGYRFCVTDAVFSMDGDCADLTTLTKLARKYQSILMIDDAHGFGVLGEKGKGLPELQNIQHKAIDCYMATCGKAMGVAGAFIAGSNDFIDALIQFSRTYTYTTAMPAAQAVALSESLTLIKEESWRRKHLQELITYFKQCAEQINLKLMPSDTAIQPILIGDTNQAVHLAEDLYQKGVLVTAVRPPTVPKNTSRIRITLSTEHKKSHIDYLFECLMKSLYKI